MNREQWGPFLKVWSEEWIAGHDPEQDFPLDDEAVRNGWLGYAPASADEVASAEARLGRTFPPSFREFLLTTNGWRDAGAFIHRLAGTSDLAWLADTDDSSWIRAYRPRVSADEIEVAEYESLARSLRLSLAGDAAVMFLDPGDANEHGEWAGYWLSSWSGEGPERFDSFYDLMYDQYTTFHSLRRQEDESGS